MLHIFLKIFPDFMFLNVTFQLHDGNKAVTTLNCVQTCNVVILVMHKQICNIYGREGMGLGLKSGGSQGWISQRVKTSLISS